MRYGGKGGLASLSSIRRTIGSLTCAGRLVAVISLSLQRRMVWTHGVLTCSGSFGQPRLSLADLTHCVPIFDSTTRASPGASLPPLISCEQVGCCQLLCERKSGRGETYPDDCPGSDEDDEQDENASEADKPECGAQSRPQARHRRFPTMARLSREARRELGDLGGERRDLGQTHQLRRPPCVVSDAVAILLGELVALSFASVGGSRGRSCEQPDMSRVATVRDEEAGSAMRREESWRAAD